MRRTSGSSTIGWATCPAPSPYLFSPSARVGIYLFLSFVKKVNVLSYDYRGYGLHPGVPTESSCFADIEGAYDLLTKEFKIPPSRIILYAGHTFRFSFLHVC